LYSCHDTNHHDIPKEKIPLLKNNDIICFQDSISGNVDTFRLNIIDSWHQTLEGDYFRYINIYYNKYYLETLFLHLWVSSASIDGIIFNIDNYSWQSANDFKINFTLLGITYPYVYIRHNISSDTNTIPNTVYLTYSNGIIRYEYKDGRVYNIVSK